MNFKPGFIERATTKEASMLKNLSKSLIAPVKGMLTPEGHTLAKHFLPSVFGGGAAGLGAGLLFDDWSPSNLLGNMMMGAGLGAFGKGMGINDAVRKGYQGLLKTSKVASIDFTKTAKFLSPSLLNRMGWGAAAGGGAGVLSGLLDEGGSNYSFGMSGGMPTMSTSSGSSLWNALKSGLLGAGLGAGAGAFTKIPKVNKALFGAAKKGGGTAAKKVKLPTAEELAAIKAENLKKKPAFDSGRTAYKKTKLKQGFHPERQPVTSPKMDFEFIPPDEVNRNPNFLQRLKAKFFNPESQYLFD